MTLDPNHGLGAEPAAVTVGQLRQVIGYLPDAMPLVVAVRDRGHVGTFLDLAVASVEVTGDPRSPMLVFDAAEIF